jgi:hypothetical protein
VLNCAPFYGGGLEYLGCGPCDDMDRLISGLELVILIADFKRCLAKVGF